MIIAGEKVGLIDCATDVWLVAVATHVAIEQVFGWFFERQAECLKDPRIIFYGCYIDDCLSIIYAYSEDEALNIINKLKIRPCIIEWNSSQWSQPFLDMLLFVDENNKLQHKPFRKARSHGFLITHSMSNMAPLLGK